MEDTEQMNDKMNPKDLEECDEYPLPEWWDNDKFELRPIKKSPKIKETIKLKDIYKK